MDSYQLYKSIYDREISRRKDLDAAINLPMTILSIIVAANFYLIKENSVANYSLSYMISVILVSLIVIGLLISIFYLARSYNNLLKGFAYRNLPLTEEIRKYENELEKYNKKVDKENQVSFENIIIERMTNIIDNHIIFNDKRSRDLYRTKTSLIICIVLTVINFIIFLSTFLNI